MKNIFIQKLIPNKEVANKESRYLVTINRGAKLEEATIMWKEELLAWLKKKLS